MSQRECCRRASRSASALSFRCPPNCRSEVAKSDDASVAQPKTSTFSRQLCFGSTRTGRARINHTLASRDAGSSGRRIDRITLCATLET